MTCAYPGPLFTDLYELTMAAAYFERDMDAEATFSLFVRPVRPPAVRGYFVAAGLAEALQALVDFRFKTEDIDYLRSQGLFSQSFINFLGDLRFTGDVCALPEGTLCFANEPFLEVTAPLIQAQLLETYLINAIGLPSMIASKAARCVTAAQGRPLIDFSLRRTQGIYAGMQVARSAYMVGFAGTSNVLAGQQYGIPISGTMAHSYISAFESEAQAFRAYADQFPNSAIFLIDTYDTLTGARNAVKVAREMKQRGRRLKGVRLDSGDMVGLSRQVRHILDEAGLSEVKIFASSSFDEEKIARVLAAGAAIDAFGVGTKMGVSADAPYLDMVYKLVHLGDRNIRKLSPGKVNLAGRKQVFRQIDNNGSYLGDTIAVRDESVPGSRPLLEPVMHAGRLTASAPALNEIRGRFAKTFGHLPQRYKDLYHPPEYPVSISPSLQTLQQ